MKENHIEVRPGKQTEGNEPKGGTRLREPLVHVFRSPIILLS